MFEGGVYMKALILSIEKENFNIDDNLELLKNQGLDFLGTLNVKEKTKLCCEDNLMGIGINADMNIYPEYRKVVINNTEIDLRKKEFDILYYLAINKGRVLTFAQIISSVWGEEYCKNDHYLLWNQIKNLRKKITDVFGKCEYIECIKGVGYKFKSN